MAEGRAALFGRRGNDRFPAVHRRTSPSVFSSAVDRRERLLAKRKSNIPLDQPLPPYARPHQLWTPMRAALCLLLITSACSRARSDPSPGGIARPGSPDSDAGNGPSGTPDLPDGGTLSAGPPAPPVPGIAAAPCPGTPQLLWSRT